MSMKGDAAKRGERAKKLFTKTGDAEFAAILAALTKEEKHRMDPITNWESGKPDFFAAVWKAVVKDKSLEDDPSHGLSDAELADFVSDLWNATWGARKGQETKPCW